MITTNVIQQIEERVGYKVMISDWNSEYQWDFKDDNGVVQHSYIYQADEIIPIDILLNLCRVE